MITLRIQNGKFLEMSMQDVDVLFGVVRTDSFRQQAIPLTPNPRTFTSRNPNYLRMLKTINEEPHLFLHKNSSGIVIFAEDFKVNGDGSVTVSLDEGRHGVGGGGHTLEACKNFGTPEAYVKVQVVKGLPEEHLIDVVESLNLSKRLESFSLDNRRGLFDWHKEQLGEKAEGIRYFEGDQGLTDIREEIGALHVFLYTKEGGKRPLSAYRGSVNVNHHGLLKLRKDVYARQVAAISADVHDLYRHVITSQHYIGLCDLSHLTGWKRRLLQNNEYGLIRSVANLVLLGVAMAGTSLDEDGVVRWKPGYTTHGLRCRFADQMFQKVFDILVVEDGTMSSKCKRESVVEKVVRQAEILAAQHGGHQQIAFI